MPVITKKAILLNKIFKGGWLTDREHIGHEIIDFILADNGKHYAYFNPWGSVQKSIVVEGDTNYRLTKGTEYETKYLLLTSGYNKSSREVEIYYIIELKRKIHNLSYTRSEDPGEVEKKFNKIKRIIINEDIRYNGKLICDIYPRFDSNGKPDTSLFVTFEAKKLYKPKHTLVYAFNKSIIRGNKFAITNDKGYERDYANLDNLISNAITNNDFDIIVPETMAAINSQGLNFTFIDLIDYNDLEQAYTNILCSILRQNGLMKDFCLAFKETSAPISTSDFKLFKEKKIVDGRMDICAISEDKAQKVVIENKINSGLNGVKADSTTQLSTYHEWARSNILLDPLCFLTYPDINDKKLREEIAQNDPDMATIYKLVSYSKVADFLDANKSKVSTNYTYYKYLDDIISVFRNMSYKSKEKYYAKLFYEATL